MNCRWLALVLTFALFGQLLAKDEIWESSSDDVAAVKEEDNKNNVDAEQAVDAIEPAHEVSQEDDID